MNRRNFLGSIATSLMGGLISWNLPTSWVPKPIRKHFAQDLLTTEWNRYYKIYKHVPTEIYAGADLFNAIEAELDYLFRFVDSPSPYNEAPAFKFKSSTLRRKGSGWRLEMGHDGLTKYITSSAKPSTSPQLSYKDPFSYKG